MQPSGNRETQPAPGPLPADKVPTRPTEEVYAETKPPPNRANRALARPPTNSGLGYGVPSPSFGGDTDFDTRDGGAVDTRDGGAVDARDGGAVDEPPANLRQTSSFERAGGRPEPRLAPPLTLSEPPAAPSLDLGFGDESPASEALDLVGRHEPAHVGPAEPSRRGDPLAELRERYALGDFSGALTIAEAILEDEPDNADAQRYAESCRVVLKQMYAARLGALSQVPIVAIPAEQLRWLTLDHRSGFLLSHVDGVSTLEEILDISGMNHLEAMRIIYELLQQKVIALQ